MSPSYLVLIPPLLVLAIARVTRNVLKSLLIGIIVAGIIASNFSPLDSILLILRRLIEQTAIPDIIAQNNNYDKLYMLGFLLFLGILIELMAHAGSLALYTQALLKRVKTPKGAQYTVFMLSLCFFIDDYLSSLVVGSITKPLMDHLKIPRIKLAFLINSLSSPLCVIIPATSWVAMTITQLQAIGINHLPVAASLMAADPFSLYLQAIPYLMYPFLMIFSVLFVISRSISFGLMHEQEQIAQKTGNLFGGKEPLNERQEESTERKPSGAADLLFALVTFLGVALTTLIYTGGWSFFGGENSLVTALMRGQSNLALFLAIISAVSVKLFLLLQKQEITFTKFILLCHQGGKLMANSLLVLMLAWALSALLQYDLQTGQFIAHLFLGSVSYALLPVIVFLTAVVVSASTGSSWGTIMFLTPLTLPLAATFIGSAPLPADAVPALAPILGALLSGSIAGVHFTPISDTIIISAISAGAYHSDHIQSQSSYSLPVLIATTIGFLILGLLLQNNAAWALLFALLSGVCICVGYFLARNQNRTTT